MPKVKQRKKSAAAKRATTTKKSAASSTTAALKQRLAEMEFQHERLRAVQEVQNVMGRYAYTHTAKLHKETAKLFAKKTPGTKLEIVGFGIWDGPGRAAGFYSESMEILEAQLAGRGTMMQHTLTTPVIEIAGDGKTAKGVWISPGHETQRQPDGTFKAYWAWCYYADDFVKEDGEWKIWKHHVYLIFYTPYDKPWTEGNTMEEPPLAQDPRLKPDRPPSYHWCYSPETTPEYVPAPPVPYETFDEETAYVK